MRNKKQKLKDRENQPTPLSLPGGNLALFFLGIGSGCFKSPLGRGAGVGFPWIPKNIFYNLRAEDFLL